MTDVQSLLTVKDLIKDKIVFVRPNNSVYEAAKIMEKNQITSVLVKDASEKIVGIVTNSDIVYKIVATNVSSEKTKMGKIMSRDLLTIEGNESMFKARQIMLDKNVRHLIVTSDNNQIGVVTAKEILGEK